MTKMLHIVILMMAIFHLGSCREELGTTEIVLSDDSTLIEIDRSDYLDWSDETHSNNSEADYGIVFNQDDILRIDITIDSDDWSSMKSDLSSNISSGGRPGQGNADVDFTPVWAPCSVFFNGTEWYEVGVRFKGNSSLKSTYQSGNNKFSFKLDFDEFEDDYPALSNQRFYGFRQLNLNNNFDDASFLREKVASDLFRDFGLVSAKTSFCQLYVDNGSGPKYYGVYTLVEEMDDTVLDDQLGASNGNLYKPDGDAASFSRGSYNEDEMEKKNNEDLADYADVKSLYDILNDASRTSDAEQWRMDLEEILNVDVFMKWLAANTAIQNWDTYGVMTHNYYLYNNHTDSLLTWVPWDNNEAFQYGKQGGALSLSLDEVGDFWPLIRYLMDIDAYKDIYKAHLRSFVNDVFVPATMIQTYNSYYNLLKEAAYAEESGYSFLRYDSQFDQAIETLKTHVQDRNDAVNAFLK